MEKRRLADWDWRVALLLKFMDVTPGIAQAALLTVLWRCNGCTGETQRQWQTRNAAAVADKGTAAATD